MASTKKPKIKKTFALEWLLEPLQHDDTFLTKKMFGGLAVYYQGLFVLMLTESPGERTWQGTKYDFDLWNGILFPTFREHHASLLNDWPKLVAHPVLGKWLYAPTSLSCFEDYVMAMVEKIRTHDSRFGIEPGQGKKKKKTNKRG